MPSVKKSINPALIIIPVRIVMQYNCNCPLYGLVNREKFMCQFKIDSMKLHIILTHNRNTFSSLNFFSRTFVTSGLLRLDDLTRDQFRSPILVGSGGVPK